MKSFKLKLLNVITVSIFGMVHQSWAAEFKGVSYSVEPIVGYEIQKKENPTRTRGVVTYGARVVAGYQILSLEGEYTEGTSNESMVSPVQTVNEKVQKARVGVRSQKEIIKHLNASLRGGAEVQKRTTTTTTLTSTSTTVAEPNRVYPYLGLGLGFHISENLRANFETVITVKDFQKIANMTEISTSFGLRIGFVTR